MASSLVHFEIPASDPALLKRFYGGVFGWRFEPLGGRVEYWSVEGAGLGGAIMRKVGPNSAPIQYYLVEDIDQSCAAIRKRGGRVQHPKQANPGRGWFSICIDPEGNPFGLWQEDPAA